MITVEEASPGDAEPARRSAGRQAKEWALVIIVALSASLLIRHFIVAPYKIPSESMEATLRKGDRILVNRLSYRLHDVRRGDVVVFHKPPNSIDDPLVKDLVKRVIGLPGEVVEIRDCQVFVDGRHLQEPYVQGDCTGPGSAAGDPDGNGLIEVPAGSYFVMGDNRGFSLDGRYWGFLDEDLIVGRAFVLIYPFGRWAWL